MKRTARKKGSRVFCKIERKKVCLEYYLVFIVNKDKKKEK